MIGSLAFKWRHEPAKQAARMARRVSDRMFYTNLSTLPPSFPSLCSLLLICSCNSNISFLLEVESDFFKKVMMSDDEKASEMLQKAHMNSLNGFQPAELGTCRSLT